MALFETKPKSGTPRTAKPKVEHRQPTGRESNLAKEAIQSTIAVADFSLATFLSSLWAPPRFDDQGNLVESGDTLNEFESKLLTEGIYGEIELHPNAVIKIAQIAQAGNAHTKLAKAALLIALPRLERRNVVPGYIAQRISQILILGLITDGESDNAVHMESGGAYGGVGSNGSGQEHASSVASDALQEILRRPIDKARSEGQQNRVSGSDSDNGKRARGRQSGGQLGEDESWLTEESPGAVSAQTEVLGTLRESA